MQQSIAVAIERREQEKEEPRDQQIESPPSPLSTVQDPGDVVCRLSALRYNLRAVGLTGCQHNLLPGKLCHRLQPQRRNRQLLHGPFPDHLLIRIQNTQGPRQYAGIIQVIDTLYGIVIAKTDALYPCPLLRRRELLRTPALQHPSLLHGLILQIKLPPQKEQNHSCSQKDQILFCNSTLLCLLQQSFILSALYIIRIFIRINRTARSAARPSSRQPPRCPPPAQCGNPRLPAPRIPPPAPIP